MVVVVVVVENISRSNEEADDISFFFSFNSLGLTSDPPCCIDHYVALTPHLAPSLIFRTPPTLLPIKPTHIRPSRPPPPLITSHPLPFQPISHPRIRCQAAPLLLAPPFPRPYRMQGRIICRSCKGRSGSMVSSAPVSFSFPSDGD